MNTEYQQDNLILRVLTEADDAAVLDFYQRNSRIFDIYETDKPDNFYTKGFINNYLAAEYNAFLHGKHVRFFLFEKGEPKKIIGTVSFSDIKRSMQSCVIGYKIDEAYQHKGYGRRMLSIALRIMVSQNEMHRIEAYIHPDNHISKHLAKNLGFIEEGTAYEYAKINGKWTDHERFVFISH